MSLRITFLLLLLSAGLAARAETAPVLVDTAWAAARASDPDVVFVDMSDDPQYDRFHIPGAVRLPVYALYQTRKEDRVPVPLSDSELVALLGKLGISRQHYVVAYDDSGGFNAGRLYWALEGIAHPRVSVIDGGLVKWILEGRKVSNVAASRPPLAYGTPGKGRANLARMDDVRKAGALLIDARTDEEYLGDLRQQKGGHIPGARHWEWSRSVDVAQGFVRRPAADLAGELAAIGAGDKGKPVIAYCASGHRAAQVYLTLRSLGYERVQLYANSMNEYGLYHGRDLRRGDQP
jgi:thiosulfate/3-mercaptopyruvate sulfurtransferase